MFFKLMTLVHVCAAFPLKCPEPAQWRLRANGHCADPSKYFCLRNDLIKKYSENCTRSDFQQPGRKSVLRGGIDADVCSEERYQPFPLKFFSNASSHCIFLKSLCNEEGQVVYDHGNRNTDATCRCNYRHGYAFIVKPNHPCFCKPLQEDCSCFMKLCSNSSHFLSPDNKCMHGTDVFPVTQCRPISEKNDNYGNRPAVTENTSKEDNISVPVIHYEDDLIIPSKRPRKGIVVFTSCYIICGATVMVLLVLFIRRNSLQGRREEKYEVRIEFEAAREESVSAQRNGIFNWKLLKKCLEPVDIFKALFTGEFVKKELWDFIENDSRRSQMDSILTNALRNIQTSDDYDKFEAIIVKCNDEIILQTPKDNIILVDRKTEDRLRGNRELIEKELYPKDYIDSFLEQFIISLEDHEVLRNKENIRQTLAHSFLETIRHQSCIKRGSMKCLIDSLNEDDSEILKRLSKLMASALPNGISNFIGDRRLQALIKLRDDCRNSILCKWTYLKENFNPDDVIMDQLYNAGLVDEDRKEILREKPRHEMVYSTLRNVVRKIDGPEMFYKFRSILKKENRFISEELDVKAEKMEFAFRKEHDTQKLKNFLQKYKNDIEKEFDSNYIDTFVELYVFDVDDHEMIWEASHYENGRAKCFYKIISDIKYIKKGSIDCLAECLENSKYRRNMKQPLARLLLLQKIPEQVVEIKRSKINLNPEEEKLFPNNTDKLTTAEAVLEFEDTDTKDTLEIPTCDAAGISPLEEIEGLKSKPEDTKRSSVVIHLQSDGENVKYIVEKSIGNGDLTTFIMNLLDDENIKIHMSPGRKYKLSVSIHSKDQQTGSYLEDPKMRIIKANRKLLEDEYDPMPLLKAVFVGNLKKYKSTENLSPENLADFKQQFSEINEIPERRKRVKQFLNFAEDTIEADKLWELIEDTANTFSIKKMRDDLNSGQNDNSSSDEGLVFKGKYEVWKTEEDVNSPLQSFILEESKKKGNHHKDTMSNTDLKRSLEIYLPGMRNAYELESDSERSVMKTNEPTNESDLLSKSEEPIDKIRQTVHQSEVTVSKKQETVFQSDVPENETLETVCKSEDNVNKTQETVLNIEGFENKARETVYQSEMQGIKTTKNVHDSEISVNETRDTIIPYIIVPLHHTPCTITPYTLHHFTIHLTHYTIHHFSFDLHDPK